MGTESGQGMPAYCDRNRFSENLSALFAIDLGWSFCDVDVSVSERLDDKSSRTH